MTSEQILIPGCGRMIEADLYRPQGEHFPVAVICHGFNGSRGDAVTTGEFLASNGVCAVAINFCGGSPCDGSGFPSTQMTLFTERDDALCAVAYARSIPGADPDRVFLYGASQGGMVSTLAAGTHPQGLAGLMLLFPAYCIPDDWRRAFPDPSAIPDTVDFCDFRLGRGFFLSIRELDVFSLMAAYPGPVMLMHGVRDEVVPIAYSRRAAHLWHAPLHVFPGEGHGFSPQGSARADELVLAFIRTHGPILTSEVEPS